ncbi:hypothetical protein L596_028374 [Steinernema carpocapsae]|uniref:Uncharacterized protein n=1 Tax=Steinernema carpocapsae TaxID=34508 RepID=A0A4U5LY77_STECR|nr:hypothetical protein L596_028374 [Steinernema carpocapsae]
MTLAFERFNSPSACYISPPLLSFLVVDPMFMYIKWTSKVSKQLKRVEPIAVFQLEEARMVLDDQNEDRLVVVDVVPREQFDDFVLEERVEVADGFGVAC